ncbi:CaiB/BaiF CoA transferase family protein [Rhodococcus sp. CH91]|uniref:CaiB/BaiF CoA transferase family protein n=1 Tax=Rhodococcus sp. CH91 TaxID=2910256 RepID=UPI0024083EEC|nr:CaiB/BaiF CoA-transferase family protein [Rhodococcus sp. CH91]
MSSEGLRSTHPAPGSTGRGWPRIVDFSTHFSGPMASRALVHLGADVVKVENPRGGDGNRQVGNPFAGTSDVHHALNAGTRSIALDRRSETWPLVVDALTKWADVVIVGARPEDARKRGLDAETLLAVDPGLVYCSVTGYGDDGPWSALPAHGLQPDVMAGLVEVEWHDGMPRVPASYQAHGTALAGLWAALGIQAALLRRLRGEPGQVVSVSIWEAALAWMWREAQAGLNDLPSRPAFQAMGSRYRMYVCSDGRVLLVCPIERKYWERFVDIVGLPESYRTTGSWERGADYGAGRDDETAVIAASLATRPAHEWEALFAGAGVPAAMVRTVREAVDTDHARHLGVSTTLALPRGSYVLPLSPVAVVPVEGAHPGTEAMARRRRERGAGLTAAPELGADTAGVLTELGLHDLAAELAAAQSHRAN